MAESQQSHPQMRMWHNENSQQLKKRKTTKTAAQRVPQKTVIGKA